MSLKLGINESISNKDYHSDKEFVSSSGLKLLYNDPKAYYERYVLGVEESTPPRLQAAFDFGSYLHTMILEPELLGDEYLIYSGPEEDEEAIDSMREANPDRTIITASQVKAANTLYKEYSGETVELGSHGDVKDVPLSSFFQDGEAEQTFCAEIDGVKIKVRCDYRKETSDGTCSIQDVKTTSGKRLSRYDVEKTCEKYGYALSAALYCDVVEAVTGKRHDFYFLFLSKNGGGARMFKASETFLKRGRDQYQIALKRLKKAKETGVYYEHRLEELR